MKKLIHSIAAVLAVFPVTVALHAKADHGHHAQDEAFSAGQPGDPKKPARIVQVTMTEADGKMLFAPSRIEIKKDEQVKFMLRNNSELDHEFVLATTEENLEHCACGKIRTWSMTVRMQEARSEEDGRDDLEIQQDRRVRISCLIPGHREAGMIGTIVVK